MNIQADLFILQWDEHSNIHNFVPFVVFQNNHSLTVKNRKGYIFREEKGEAKNLK